MTATQNTRSLIKNALTRQIAQLIWLILVGSIVGVFIYSTPGQFELFRTSARFAVGYQAVLTQIGMSASVYAGYFLVLDIIQALIVTGVALLVFALRRDDGLALWVSAGMVVSSITTIPGLHEIIPNISVILFILSSSATIITLFIFPDGQFVPRWTRWLAPLILLGPLAVIIIQTLQQGATLEDFNSNTLIGGLSLLQWVGIGSQVYRYLRVSDQTRRQQSKWVVIGFSISIFAGLLFVAVPLIFPELTTPSFAVSEARYTLPSLIWMMISVLIVVLGLSAIPVSLALSMIRYRLWDVDLTINRLLVSALIGLSLLLIFTGVFFGIRYALTFVLAAENAQLGVGIAGLVVGVSFNPTRTWIRKLVDRRVYGFRFDLRQLQKAKQLPVVKNPGALTGQTIGGYQLTELLGRGGMGEVYKGHGEQDNDIVAIKVLPIDMIHEPTNIERFAREGEVAQKLQHRNIVHTYANGTDGVHPYIVLEYLDGQTLKEHIHANGRFSMDAALSVIASLASALDAVHEVGFVHRDLKPSNVMLRLLPDRETYEAVLMDFGIAKVVGWPTLTGSGAIGTIEYMAPEQITSARTVDRRADIYALGILAYEMLVGVTPFKNTENPAQVLFHHLFQPAPNPCEALPALPVAVGQAIMSAMAKEPDERPVTASAFAQMIEQGLASAA
jgi:hypothetical protein